MVVSCQPQPHHRVLLKVKGMFQPLCSRQSVQGMVTMPLPRVKGMSQLQCSRLNVQKMMARFQSQPECRKNVQVMMAMTQLRQLRYLPGRMVTVTS